MKELSIKELIKDNHVYFDSLRQGYAYYTLKVPNGKLYTSVDLSFGDFPPVKEYQGIDSYLFTIPLNDIGNGTLRASMKAIEVMRWIRKALENKELIKQNEPSRKTETIA